MSVAEGVAVLTVDGADRLLREEWHSYDNDCLQEIVDGRAIVCAVRLEAEWREEFEASYTSADSWIVWDKPDRPYKHTDDADHVCDLSVAWAGYLAALRALNLVAKEGGQ